MRWQATITYRTEGADLVLDHHMEELEELHDIIERGPDWNCIIDIFITLTRSTSPNLTVEKSESWKAS